MKTLSYGVGLMAGLLFVVPVRGQTNDPPPVPPASSGAVTNAGTMKALLDTAKVKATNWIEWARKDIDRIGAWKYKVVVCKGAEVDHAAVEARLNELGKEGWECFWVREKREEITFYLKKAERSTITEALKYRP